MIALLAYWLGHYLMCVGERLVAWAGPLILGQEDEAWTTVQPS